MYCRTSLQHKNVMQGGGGAEILEGRGKEREKGKDGERGRERGEWREREGKEG